MSRVHPDPDSNLDPDSDLDLDPDFGSRFGSGSPSGSGTPIKVQTVTQYIPNGSNAVLKAIRVLFRKPP